VELTEPMQLSSLAWSVVKPNQRIFRVLRFLRILKPKYSRIPISRTLGFSKLPIIRTKTDFPSPVNHCNFTPDFSNTSMIRTNLLFPRRFEKSGFHCKYSNQSQQNQGTNLTNQNSKQMHATTETRVRACQDWF